MVVRFAYSQTLEPEGKGLRFRVPVCPGVRYIPGRPLLRSLSGPGTEDDTDLVPDASRISPPRIDALHPDAAYFAITGQIDRAEVASGSLGSPSHPLRWEVNSEGIRVGMADEGRVPDSDLVLAWHLPDEVALAPRGWRYLGADGMAASHALVRFRAPDNVAVVDHVATDYYFLVDRSGSMEGEKWVKSCEALHEFVRLLGPKDRLWITLFESSFTDFAERLLSPTEISSDQAFQNLVRRGTGGGTELWPAAQHVLEMRARESQGGRAVLVLITDGEVGNERQLHADFRRLAGDLTIFTFGIDTTVNDALLRNLARQHRGSCCLQTPQDDIAATVAGLGDRLRRPVVTDLHVLSPWEPAMRRLPDLFAGQTISLSLRAAATESRAVLIEGRLADGRPARYEIQLESSDNPALRLLWARERIAEHEAAEELAHALVLARVHNLLCPGGRVHRRR